MGRRFGALALLAAATLVVAGCSWLMGYGPYGPYGPGPYPSEPSLGPSAAYTTGKATIAIDKDPAIELGTLVEGGAFDASIGVGATFRGDDGWYLRLMGATKGNAPYASTFLTIDRVRDGQHWTTGDPTGCSISITKADATGLTGKASCKGLRWTDAMISGLGNGYQPPYVKDQAPFDAEITFEAAPSASQAG